MDRKILFQKIKKEYSNEWEIANVYFSLLSELNGFKLTQRELELMAFTAIRGTISYAVMREEFCEMFNTSLPTINNIISKLKRMGILVKDNGKVKVHPVFNIDFKKNVVLQISLMYGEATEHVGEGVSDKEDFNG